MPQSVSLSAESPAVATPHSSSDIGPDEIDAIVASGAAGCVFVEHVATDNEYGVSFLESGATMAIL